MSKQKTDLIEQLEVLIKKCQSLADVLSEKGMVISEASSLAMKVAYMNVKTFIENNEGDNND